MKAVRMKATFHLLFIVTAAVLLCGALSDAQDAIRNFQVANRNSTHITFSWDIVDGYYTSSYISYFYIYYRERSGYSGYRSYIGSISYSDSYLIKIGPSFHYTTTVTSFNNYGQYVMAVYVYRPRLVPTGIFSEEIYVEVGRQISIEVNIQLWPSQTCHEFTEQSTSTYLAMQNEVYWGIRKYCRCNYNYIQYISLNNGYFTCAAGGYVTFRAHLYSTSITADPADVKNTLTAWLHGQDTDKTITIYGMQYSVEPGPCGVTVPHLYAPKCSTPNTTAAPTDAAVSSIITTPTEDNTAVIVASVFATMFFILSLGLIGYILAARRHQTTRSTGGRAVRKTTRPSNAPAHAATRREQPITTTNQQLELQPGHHNTDSYTNDPDQIYAEMDYY